MKTKKKLTSRAGFTLVELVVTIAVLAILAGVGAVSYSGYITRAKDAKDVAELANVLTAAQGAVATDADGAALESISIKPDGTVAISPSVGTTAATDTFVILYGNNGKVDLDSSGSYKTGAHWTSTSGWEAGES